MADVFQLTVVLNEASQRVSRKHSQSLMCLPAHTASWPGKALGVMLGKACLKIKLSLEQTLGQLQQWACCLSLCSAREASFQASHK